MSDSPTAPASAPREFVVRRRPFKSSYTIWRTSGTPGGYPIPVHYVKIGTRIGRAPELALLDGPYDDAATVAVCHMPAFSLDYKIGFGSPEAPNDMIWEDMVARGAGTEYRMELTLFRSDCAMTTAGGGTGPGEGLSRKRGFVWRRIERGPDKDKDKDKDGKAWGPRGWRMADGESGLVAAFVEHAAKGVCGRLTLEEGRASDLDIVAMITLLALYERRRRS
ncbi:hypothetical protein ESCO_000089 [Escovopsis weberi]|uniref:Uncharacterized protein n=1 Tax=Escovopsis weberi TaxID=150374 RepID=A0A0M8N4D5_ESCWE|nr:hypothetical protein ESCO_000089 [Escovopsis weberi]